MITLTVSIQVACADDAAAEILNTKIVNEAKKIPNARISSGTIKQLTSWVPPPQ